MRTNLFILGILIALIGSSAIIYSNHYVVNGYSSVGLVFIIMCVPVAIAAMYFLSIFSLEIAYRLNKKNLRVKAFRRPILAIILIFGIGFGLTYLGWRFTSYIETSAQSMADTLKTMLFPIGIGGVVAMISTFLDY
jgi:membrane protease YdiL (CAAX protease family)